MAVGTARKHMSKSKGARRRMRLFLTIVFGFSAWAGLTFWEQMGTIQHKEAELKRLQTQYDEVRALNEEYRSEVTRLNDNEYIEQRVRKDFGMVRPGDKVFVEPAE